MNGDIPDIPITEELLEDGSFLREAIEICNKNRSFENTTKLLRILRDSLIWIPCNAILSDADYAAMEQVLKEEAEKDGLDSLIGKTLTNQDEIRMVPDILQSGENYFFPVFTSAEEMGEYGENFSKIQDHFLEAMNLAIHNEKDVYGIVINAFSESFVVPRELFEVIAQIPSSIEGEG